MLQKSETLWVGVQKQLSVGFYSLQTCLDIIQASADPSSSLPRAKRSLPRNSAAHVFHCLLPQTFRRAWFTRSASASIGAERKVILSEVVFRRSLCRLGLHWATHATWPLACKHGAALPRSFRGASAELPQSFRKASAKYAGRFRLFGLLLASALRVSVAFFVRSNTFSSTGIVSPSFSMHALKHLVVYQPQSFRKPSANKSLPRAFRMIPRVRRGAHFQE